MSVDIPGEFDDMQTHGNKNATEIRGGDSGTPAVKTAGGVNITEDGADFEHNTTSGDAGLIWNVPVSYDDFTDKLFIVSHTFNAQNRIQIDTLANSGVNVYLFSTVGDPGTPAGVWKKWKSGGNDTKRGQASNGHLCYVIDAAATAQETNGSFAITTVAAWGFSTRKLNLGTSTSTTWGYMSNAVQMGTTKSATDIPRLYGSGVKMADLWDTVVTTSYDTVKHNYVVKLGTTYEVNCPFVIGKATTTTSFDDEGVTVISPESNNSADPRFHLTTSSMRVYLDLQSSDTATFSGTYIWGTKAPWDFDTAETVTFSSPTFQGMGRITIGSGIDGPANFVDTDILLDKSDTWDLDGSTFSNPGTATQLMEIG